MDGINGGLNRQDGIPLDEAWLSLGADGGVMNVPGDGGRSWEGTNNLEMDASGAFEGIHLVNDAFSLTCNINARGRPVESQNAGRHLRGSGGIGMSFFPTSPEDSNQMVRVNVNPVNLSWVSGRDVNSAAFLDMDTSMWINLSWRPSVSAMWMDTKRGVGALLKLSADAISGGAYILTEPVEENADNKTGETTRTVSKEFERVGVTPKAEVFYAPWFDKDTWYRGLTFHADYEHNIHQYDFKDFDGGRELVTTVGWGQILAGARLSFGGDKDKPRESALFNMQ